MKVQQMTSSRSGKPVANQFIVEDDEGNRWFQSYGSIIAKIGKTGPIWLDSVYWDYSVTTLKYLCRFLPHNHNAGGIRKCLADKDCNTYKLVNLNVR